MLGNLVPLTVRPPKWMICFYRTSPLWWVKKFVPGKYKHVACFGYLPGQDVWVFFNPAIEATDLMIVPQRHAGGPIGDMLQDALVVEVNGRIGWPRRRWHPVAVCATQVAAVVGIPSRALRPDGFLKDCLRDGGTIVELPQDGVRSQEPAEAAAGGR